jgi:hypothetical protein
MSKSNGTGPEYKGKITGKGLGNRENSLKEPKFIIRHGKP